MSALASEQASNSGTREPDALALLLLVRAACEGGATRSEIVKDLAPLIAHKLSPAEWRQAAEASSTDLVAAGLVTEKRGRLVATPDGAAACETFLGLPGPLPSEWADVRDIVLVAKALGISGEPAARLKSLTRPEALCAIIVQQAYALPLKRNEAAARIRARLALIALQRAFGNKIKASLGAGAGLSAKAGRTLAGQLSRKPRDFASDAKLIAELAAEQVDATRADLDQLRHAILKRLGTRVLEARAAHKLEVKRPSSPPPNLRAPANDTSRLRPNLPQFANAVQDAARSCAEGWPGNRKAFIAEVWSAMHASAPQWGLSEIEFKCMLAEAHRTGAVILASADLKDKKDMALLEGSAIQYKNTVWHFVRVDD